MSTFAELQSRIQAYADAQTLPADPPGLYEPCSYILGLGGKRLRPVLALMAYELFGDDVDAALPVAWAVELFHNFSLMHDDIMDAAPLRRGQPSVHARWNTNTAILSGDALLIMAYKQLASFADEPVIPKLLDAFNRIAIGVCEGQQLDLNFEQRSDVSVNEYLHMIELKTAVLLGGALELGALAGRASNEDAAALYEFGCLAGIAFQIQDDLLDAYGDPSKFGKQVGGDILQNKKTLLVLKTIETASSQDRDQLQKWMSTPSDDAAAKIESVRAIFNRNDIPDRIQAEKQQFRLLAFDRLNAVSAPPERKAALREAVSALLDREN